MSTDSAQSFLQQIDQECQGLNYEALLKKAKDPIPFNGNSSSPYPQEGARVRALPILDKAIALGPNKAEAYILKAKLIGHNVLIRSEVRSSINEESYKTVYENVYRAWTLEPNEKDHIDIMRQMLSPPLECYLPGKTPVKQYLTDDQINLIAKFIVDTYQETELKVPDKLAFYKVIYGLIETILITDKNKDLLNFKINLIKLFMRYDVHTNPGDYVVALAASFLDLDEDKKSKSIYQDWLAREPDFRFYVNDTLFKDGEKSRCF